jgi:hypothetical protein
MHRSIGCGELGLKAGRSRRLKSARSCGLVRAAAERRSQTLPEACDGVAGSLLSIGGATALKGPVMTLMRYEPFRELEAVSIV